MRLTMRLRFGKIKQNLTMIEDINCQSPFFSFVDKVSPDSLMDNHGRHDGTPTVLGATPVNSTNKHAVTRAILWIARKKTFRYPPSH
jgi:hypothetical protein